MGRKRNRDYFEPHTCCYCFATSPPCSWCTRFVDGPLLDPEGDYSKNETRKVRYRLEIEQLLEDGHDEDSIQDFLVEIKEREELIVSAETAENNHPSRLLQNVDLSVLFGIEV